MSAPTGPSNRFDPSSAVYAWVGASDLALAAGRTAAAEVQTPLEEARAQLRDLQKDPKGAVDQARTRMQTQLDAAARQLEQRAADLRSNLGAMVDWEALAARGQRVVGKGEPGAEGPATDVPTAGPAPEESPWVGTEGRVPPPAPAPDPGLDGPQHPTA